VDQFISDEQNSSDAELKEKAGDGIYHDWTNVLSLLDWIWRIHFSRNIEAAVFVQSIREVLSIVQDHLDNVIEVYWW
jgi:hypothetical protein